MKELKGVPYIEFGGEKYVRMSLLKEADGIIKRQQEEIESIKKEFRKLEWLYFETSDELEKLKN